MNRKLTLFLIPILLVLFLFPSQSQQRHLHSVRRLDNILLTEWVDENTLNILNIDSQFNSPKVVVENSAGSVILNYEVSNYSYNIFGMRLWKN